MKFTKMQGTGNDFVVMDDDGTLRDWPKLAMAMCDRHFGVGADGLLTVSKSRTADCRMRLFNADGSEAEMCGNGVRCIGKYAVERGWVEKNAAELDVETLAGVRHVRVQRKGNEIISLQVSMGLPHLNADEIPVTVNQKSPILDFSVTVLDKKLKLNFVSMGNPHAVHFIPIPVADFPLHQVGPLVEHHKLFPRRTNFEIALIKDRTHIDVRVWERGCGETLACGSGACATAVAARLHNYIDNEVYINVPGGTLHIAWDGKGEVFLSGPAEFVFAGEWE